MLNVIRKKECVCCVKVREGRDKCGSGKCHQVYNITKTQGRRNYSPAAGALCTFNRYLFLFSEWIIMISINRSGWRIGAPRTLDSLLDGRVKIKFCMYSDCSKAILLLIATHANVNFHKI